MTKENWRRVLKLVFIVFYILMMPFWLFSCVCLLQVGYRWSDPSPPYIHWQECGIESSRGNLTLFNWNLTLDPEAKYYSESADTFRRMWPDGFDFDSQDLTQENSDWINEKDSILPWWLHALGIRSDVTDMMEPAARSDRTQEVLFFRVRYRSLLVLGGLVLLWWLVKYIRRERRLAAGDTNR
jgi:hypothetical protein